MSIPKFYELMLPLLHLVGDAGKSREIKTSELVNHLAEKFQLSTEERQQIVPSGRGYLFHNRVSWAATYLKAAKLIESKTRGYLKVTDRGIELLQRKPAFLSVNFLKLYPEFVEFIAERSQENPKISKEGDLKTNSPIQPDQELDDRTPEENMRYFYQQVRNSLGVELSKKLQQLSPTSFEKLVLEIIAKVFNVLPNRTKHLGKSYDGGVDGVIYQDNLELERIYIQAKRLSPETWVSAKQVREFIGSLDKHRTNKGVFVTTANFSATARQETINSSKNISLIDGRRLTELMMDYHIGCEIEETLFLQRINYDYFDAWDES